MIVRQRECLSVFYVPMATAIYKNKNKTKKNHLLHTQTKTSLWTLKSIIPPKSQNILVFLNINFIDSK